jgi:putative hydrolase of the HAD superfamily
MHGIRTVFFDAGGTLVLPREPVGVVYARAGRRHGVDADPRALMASFLETFRTRRRGDRPQDRAWWREVVDDTFRRFGAATDPTALFDELYEHFTDPASWRLVEGAIPTIETLRGRGYQTALLSNWDDRLPHLLEGLGLAPLLDPVVVSCRVGVEKPHPRIFEVALREAGVPAAAALLVGDDREADVEGARAAGMHAVHLLHDGHPAADGPTIRHLAELLDLLPGRAPRA